MMESNTGEDDAGLDLSSFETESLHKYIKCDSCGKENPKRRCSRCHYAYYCSATCQRNHWPKQHKRECLSLQDMQAEFAGFGSSSKKIFLEDETPVNSACGICFAEPMNHPWTLKGCRHGFCFACLSQWQKYSRTNSWVPAATGAKQQNPRCPFCRAEMEMDVEEQILVQAGLYLTRSNAPSSNMDVRMALVEKAVGEIEKILAADPENLSALMLKAQALKDTQPEEAMKLFEQSFRLDAASKSNIAQIHKVFAQAEEARENENMAEYERLVTEYNERSEQELPFMGNDVLLEMKLEYAETLVLGEKNVLDVISIYQDLFPDDADSTKSERPSVDRRLYSGLSQCAYRLQDYEKALVGAEAALSINPHVPGAHKLVAVIQEAQGDIAPAIRTMAQSVLYEAPWDTENTQANIGYLLQLRRCFDD